MKLMIASDIHGAAGFCRALLAACAAEAPDRLLLLGDRHAERRFRETYLGRRLRRR